MSIDFDRFGFCVLCHKNMTIEQVIDGKVQIRFTPEYIEEQFLLDDGSKMRVAMCIDCKVNYTDKDYNKIMKCVSDGWEEEIKSSNWTEDRKKRYRDKYYNLKIVTVAHNKPIDILNKELKDFKEKKV